LLALYNEYLRNEYERRIPFSYYGEDKFKPFFGSLFEVEDIVYVVSFKKKKKILDMYV